MKKNIHAFVILVTALLLAFTTACGQMDTMATVTEDTMAASLEAEGSSEAVVESNATYVEEHGLAFEDATKARTQGTICVGEDPGSLDIIGIDWEITNIAFADPVDGVQKITIEQESHGYLWKDGDTFKTNLNVPVGRLCDIYIGQMIPVNGESKTEVNWKGETYIIKATETVSWEDGDWGTGWAVSPSGEGEILPSTLKVRTDIEVTEGYNGLALVLSPITDASGSVDGNFIMNVWTDGSYLFNVSELESNFDKVPVNGEEAGAGTAISTEAEGQNPAVTPIPSEEPAESEATQKPETPAHTHSYTATVTTQPSCTVAGIKTYICNCGDSYTEDMGTTAHDYSVQIIETIHHDEKWENVPRTVQVAVICCPGCDGRFTSNDEFQAHRLEAAEAMNLGCCSQYWVEYENQTVYDYVKVSDAYDSQEVVGYRCSVCGKQK